jgi:tRNA1Val (adenine37-N6)-methyltransferase
MANSYFQFKQFVIHQDRCAMKVTTDGCLFGAWAAREVKARSHDVRNMLDIGVGTGLLSLMVAQENPHLIIDGAEIDKNAYTQAKENIVSAPFKNKIYISNSDIRDDVSGRKYDIVVCNPPFYENELQSGNAAKNIAHHDSGLLLQELLPIIKSKLVADSSFYLLLPYKRRTEVEELFQKNNLFFTKKILVRQSVKHDYFRLLIAGSLWDDVITEETEMSVRDEQGDYTTEFTKLLKDYYLQL